MFYICNIPRLAYNLCLFVKIGLHTLFAGKLIRLVDVRVLRKEECETVGMTFCVFYGSKCSALEGIG